MAKLTYFYLPSCPHCRLAARCLEELCAEDPRYADVEIERVDESAEKARAAAPDRRRRLSAAPMPEKGPGTVFPEPFARP